MATYYWVGGTGAWEDSGHWASSSGGTPGAGVPTYVDDVVFDANNGGQMTLFFNSGGLYYVNNITVESNIGGQCTFQATVSFNVELNVYGDFIVNGSNILKFSDFYCPAIRFTGTSNTIDFNDAVFYGKLTFDAASDVNITGNLVTGFTENSNYSGTVYVDGSVVNVGAGVNFTVADDLFIKNASVFNAGSGNISVGYIFSVADTSTFNGQTSTLTFTGKPDGIEGQRYFSVSIGASTTVDFYNVTLGIEVDSQSLAGESLDNFDGCNVLELQASDEMFSGAYGQKVFPVKQDFSVNTLRVVSSNVANRVLIAGYDGLESAPTITATSIDATHADFWYINVSATSVSQTKCGDWGSVSGITFDAPKNCYHVGTYYLDSPVAPSFALTSGGTATFDAFPLGQDTVIFDENTTAGAKYIEARLRGFKAIDASSLINSASIRQGTVYLQESFTGSPSLVDFTAMQVYYADNFVLDPSGTLFLSARFYSSNVSMQSSFAVVDGTETSFTVVYGSSLETNNHNITAASFGLDADSTADLGSSTITVTADIGGITAYGVMSAENATIVLDPDPLIGNYNYVRMGGNRVGKIVLNNGNDGVVFDDALNVNILERSSGATSSLILRFAEGVTHIVDRWNVSGTPSNLVHVRSDNLSQQATIQKSNNIPVSVDYLQIEQVSVSPDQNVWFAGSHSVDLGGADGWEFSAAPSGGLFAFF